jgi:hypothetical protein
MASRAAPWASTPADYDRSGRPHLLVGNFANQMLALYRNEGNGLFVDEAPSSTVGRASLLSLAFGVFFFDYDLDGQQDIFAVNGHIEEGIARVQPKVLYKQIPLMFRNLGKGRFDSVGASLGAAFNVPQVGRGAAYGDYDRDGDLDILLINNQGPARLLRNDGGNRNHWLTIRTVGTKANRDGIGAVVRVESASGVQMQTGAQRVELLLTERPCPDVRARARHNGEERRCCLAERHEGPRDRRRGEPVRPAAGGHRDREVAGDCPLYPSEGDCPQARCRPGRSTSVTK